MEGFKREDDKKIIYDFYYYFPLLEAWFVLIY